MDSWYIRDQQKVYGPYTQEMMTQFVHDKKFGQQHSVSNNQKNWYTIQQFVQMTMQITKEINVQAKKEVAADNKRLGKYEIIAELGRGGMGIVYHCRDTYLGRECAVKVILGADDERSRKRFFAEAKAIAELDHPNVIRIQEMEEFKDHNGILRSLFAMDYVKGKTLEKIIRENQLNLNQKLQIFKQVCEGMAHAHERKIIHRDLKPVNIIVTDELVPVILDFGFARKIDVSSEITKTGDMFGTPQYMAPESISGKKIVDTKSDIYALGVVLYKILTGRTPFVGDDIIGILFEMTTKLPTFPSLLNPEIKKDSDIEIICMKCLEKEPEKRILSMQLLGEEITNIINRIPIKTKPLNLIEKLWKNLLYNKTFRSAFAVFVVLCLFLTVLGVSLFYVNKAKKDAEYDKQQAQEQTQEAKIEKREAELEKQEAELKKFVKDITNMRQNINQVAFYKALNNIKEETVNSLDNFFNGKQILSMKKDVQQKFAEFYSLLRFSALPNLPKMEKVRELVIEKKGSLKSSSNLRYLAYVDHEVGEALLLEVSTQKTKKIPFKVEPGTHTVPFLFSPDEKYLVFKHDVPNPNVKKNNTFYIYNIDSDEVLPHSISVDYKYTKKSIEFSPDSKYLVYNSQSDMFLVFLEKNQQQKISSRAKDFIFSQDYLIFAPDNNDINNRFYYVYHFESKKTKELIRWEIIEQPSIAVNYDKNIFFVNISDIIQKLIVTQDQQGISIQQESIMNKSQSFMEASSIIVVDANGTIALGMKKEILLLKETVRKQEKYYYHYRNKVPADIQKLFFLYSRTLISQEKGDNIHLLDTLSRNFLYHQQDIVSFSHINNNNFVMASKSNQETTIYYRFSWETNLMDSCSLLGQSLKDYKLIQKYIQFDESTIKSGQILLSNVDNTTTIILPLKLGIVVWQKVGDNEYQNKMYFSAVNEIVNIQLSPDKKMIVMVVNDRQHSPRRQKIILTDVKNLMKEDIFHIKPIVEELKIYNGNFIRLANAKDGHKNNKEIRYVSFSNDNQNLYIPYSDEVFLYSIAKGQVVPFAEVNFKTLVIKENRESNLIAIAQEDGILSIVDKKSEKEWKNSFAIDDFNNQQKGEANIVAIDWHPIEKTIAFANIAGQVRIYHLPKNNTDTEEWENSLSLEEEKTLNFAEEIHSLSFSPNGKYLAIFTFENIYIYDIEYKYYVESYIGYHKGGVIFSDDWKYCIMPTIDSEILVFDQEYFLNDTVFQNKIKEKGYNVYFKDKHEQDNEDDNPNEDNEDNDDNYWPLRLERKFQEYIK